MAQEVEMATQIAAETIKIMINGSLAVLSVSGKAAAHGTALLAAALSSKKKTKGKVRLQNMLNEKSGVTLFSVNKSDIESFAKAAKMYGIKYCIIKDKNSKDNVLDVFVRTMDAPVINRIIEKYQITAVNEDIEINEAKGNSSTLTMNEHQSGRESQEEFKEGDITISHNINSLVVEEEEDRILTRVPGTYGDHTKYVYFEKEQLAEVYGDTSYKTHIDMDKMYSITDRHGNEVSQMLGFELYRYYDRKDKSTSLIVEEETRPSVKGKINDAVKVADSLVKTNDKSETKEKIKNRFNDFNQRTYDFKELEERLISNR